MPFRPTAVVYSKHRKPSSGAWVSRQFRDPYVKQRVSDPASYRARSAFKLLEIDSQWDHFLMKPDVNAVVDLGAAPGGWSQVVAGKLGWGAAGTMVSRAGGSYAFGGRTKEREGSWSAPERSRGGKGGVDTYDPVNIDDFDDEAPGPKGRGTIVAVDMLRMQPIKGVHTVQADFLSPETETLIHGLLGIKGNAEGKADVILSDMAANSSGNQIHDIESSLEICEAVFSFAQRNLRTAESVGRKRGGVLLMKHFTHPLLQRFRIEKLMPNFKSVIYIKPDSSRSESREGYFLCQGHNST